MPSHTKFERAKRASHGPGVFRSGLNSRLVGENTGSPVPAENPRRLASSPPRKRPSRSRPGTGWGGL